MKLRVYSKIFDLTQTCGLSLFYNPGVGWGGPTKNSGLKISSVLF
jgi:hypothetical protein